MKNYYHELQTPTIAFTTLGILSIIGWLITHHKIFELFTFLFMLLAGGGVGIALDYEVRMKDSIWGWHGIYRSLQRPSQKFYYSFFGHFFQLAIAIGIGLFWWMERIDKATKK